jgi:hypothetical protein
MEYAGRRREIQVCVTSGPQLIISMAVFSGFCYGSWHINVHFVNTPGYKENFKYKITVWTQFGKSFYSIVIISELIIVVLDILLKNYNKKFRKESVTPDFFHTLCSIYSSWTSFWCAVGLDEFTFWHCFTREYLGCVCCPCGHKVILLPLLSYDTEVQKSILLL